MYACSVYHKERGNLYKRKINPLTDNEYDTHLFKWPTDLDLKNKFGLTDGEMPKYYIIPDIGEFKESRHVTQDTIDSGFVSMGIKSTLHENSGVTGVEAN